MTMTLNVPPRTSDARLNGLPVAIIGAGPVGLAAAAQLLERGVDVIIYEAGETAGSAITQWGHTRLFSPWEYLVDEAAARLLDTANWDAPPAHKLPYGRDLVEQYLAPLAATPELAPRIRYRHRVTDVTRQGMDRTRSVGRASAPFQLRIDGPDGTDEMLARAVIDTSGTYGSSNALGSNGLNPTGSESVEANLSHALPDVLGRERERFAGKHVVVVGAGHSAANTLLKLATLAKEEPDTTVTWVIRRARPTRVYGSAADELEARGQLGSATHELVTSGAVTLLDSFEIDRLAPADNGRVTITGRRRGEPTKIDADIVVNATGFRPNLDMLREIRISLDEVVEAPRALASLIDPNEHSCGTVYPHGVAELAHPEPNFFIAGMKSYGRAPTFLLLTGYEQVRSIADELAGNHAAARIVQLVLPETGVCSTDLNTESSSCCTTAGPDKAEANCAADSTEPGGESTEVANTAGCCG
ncbi:pyridine nucleotide-disulfide oxidoreductase [Homoserinimonas aerilata]|uniref:Pyridine nucleotide-disulfide oxidoreductase n=1 Tax=Homoserinimonas aerilata TaxID=1162970 RepID=A0A542YLB4_9MICO|nr:FAD-dependent oxidoreductase [Homoserinimonas aerilata]TQL48885.1 pyridine nucleotide-disulfide oxidoreductase [Homoserinimonas aerilata]